MAIHPLLNTAIRAARRGGETIVRNIDQLHRINVEFKGRADLVSEVDRNAEQEIIQVIQRAYPDHAILAEEGGSIEGRECEWIIDPLDGTTNFLHGIPHFAVSIAVRANNLIEHAVVYNPVLNEMFTASRGMGAHLDDRRIRVSQVDKLEHALVSTGFMLRNMEGYDRWCNSTRAVVGRCQALRQPGAAALDLAYVACGRNEAFFEAALKPWDIAAGALLIEEAGGIITDFEAGSDYLTSGNVLAGTPRIQEALREFV